MGGFTVGHEETVGVGEQSYTSNNVKLIGFCIGVAVKSGDMLGAGVGRDAWARLFVCGVDLY